MPNPTAPKPPAPAPVPPATANACPAEAQPTTTTVTAAPGSVKTINDFVWNNNAPPADIPVGKKVHGGTTYKVTSTAMSDKEHGTGDMYLNVTLTTGIGRTALLRFLRNAGDPALAEDWRQLLYKFVLLCGFDKLEDTDQLVDSSICLNVPVTKQRAVLSTMQDIETALECQKRVAGYISQDRGYHK